MEEIPEFMVGLDDIWGNITDEEIVATIVELEQENEAKTQETKQASPAVYTPVAPPPTSTSRFASLSEHELNQLECDRHEKKTLDSTAWAIRVVRGEIVHK